MTGRMVVLIGGLACFSLGLVLTYQSHVGLGPWDVFHQGLARHLGLSFGTASILVGFCILCSPGRSARGRASPRS